MTRVPSHRSLKLARTTSDAGALRVVLSNSGHFIPGAYNYKRHQAEIPGVRVVLRPRSTMQN